MSLLSKGRGFCPVQKNFNHFQLIQDTKDYTRRCRLLEFFSESDPSLRPNIPPKLYVKSAWTPPSGRNAALDLYCDNMEKSILQNNVHCNTSRPKDNLSPSERQALYDFINNPRLTIREADKGGSIVVMDTSDYKSAILSMLHNPSLYKPLSSDPTSQHLAIIQSQIQSLTSLGVISPELSKYILLGEVSCPYFYGLPKIHKPKSNNSTLPPFRGIISQTNGPSVSASYWLDSIFKPLVADFCGSHWVRDTIHVLQKIQSLNSGNHLTPTTNIIAIDVVNMYNTIPHTEGISACRQALQSLSNYKRTEINGICSLLKLVLTLNNFSFDEVHYLQLTGTAMGTPVAPSYANIFMADFWRRHITPLPDQPFELLRYMDDIVAFHNGSSLQIHQFCSNLNLAHNTIKFTYSSPAQSAPFLDLSIHLIDNRLETDLYIKPTDSRFYLPPSSNHPKHIFRSIVYSGALRIKRICSLERWFSDRLQEFSDNLINSGYRINFITPIINKIKPLHREPLLSYKPKKTSNKRPIFVATHSGRLPDLPSLHKQHQHILQKSDKMSSCFPEPPLIALRQPPNLGNLLIKTKTHSSTSSNPPTQPPGNAPCCKARCKTCSFMKTTNTIEGNSFKRSMSHYITCESKNVVYLISCKVCPALYVGQTTTTLRARFNNHKYSILNKSNTPVGLHFNSHGHNGTNDISLQGIERIDPFSKARLNQRESFWMWNLGSHNVHSGLNIDEPFFKDLKFHT